MLFAAGRRPAYQPCLSADHATGLAMMARESEVRWNAERCTLALMSERFRIFVYL